MEQYMPFIWLGIALLMGILEATTAQLVSIWFMFGAIGAWSPVFLPTIL